MMKRFIKILLIIIVILLTTSCTIQKRHYRKGYYVSWHKNYQLNTHKKFETKPNEVDQNQEITINSDSIPQKNVTNDTKNHSTNFISHHVKEEKEIYKEKNEIKKHKQITNALTKEESTTHIKHSISKSKHKQVKRYTYKKRRMNKNALVAFIMFFASIPFFFYGGFITIIIAYFLAIKALAQIKNDLKSYSKTSRKFAKTVIIIYNILFGLLALFITILFINGLEFFYLLIALFYVFFGLVGLIILIVNKTKQKNSVPTPKAKNKEIKEKEKKSHNKLLIFILATIVSFGLYIILNK